MAYRFDSGPGHQLRYHISSKQRKIPARSCDKKPKYRLSLPHQNRSNLATLRWASRSASSSLLRATESSRTKLMSTCPRCDEPLSGFAPHLRSIMALTKAPKELYAATLAAMENVSRSDAEEWLRHHLFQGVRQKRCGLPQVRWPFAYLEGTLVPALWAFLVSGQSWQFRHRVIFFK